MVKYTGGSAELMFFVEGLRFPDEGFSGLVSIHVSLLQYMAEVRAPGLHHEGLPLGAGKGSFQRATPRSPCLSHLPPSTQGD